MAFVSTTVLIECLKARLEALTVSADSEERLFQSVLPYGAVQLGRAMKAALPGDDRVCFIIPGEEDHTGERSRSMVLLQRESRLALLIADRAYDAERSDALMGGPGSVGILPMKERVIESLMETPFTDGDLAYMPGKGQPLDITADTQAGTVGREAYLLWLRVYAGSSRASIP